MISPCDEGGVDGVVGRLRKYLAEMLLRPRLLDLVGTKESFKLPKFCWCKKSIGSACCKSSKNLLGSPDVSSSWTEEEEAMRSDVFSRMTGPISVESAESVGK